MFDSVISDHAPAGQDAVPTSLDSMEPGPFLAVFLSAVDVDQLSGHDRVVVLRALQRMISHYTAAVMQAMASIHDVYAESMGPGPQAAEAASAEIRTALTLTRRAADMDLGLALDLARRFPRVLEALEAGSIDLRRARVLVSTAGVLPDDDAQSVIDRVIGRAAHLTTGELGALVRRLVLEIDPKAAQLRRERAVAERRIVVAATPEGAGNLLGLDLPPHRVAAAARRIAAMARSLKTGDERRTMDQLRADVYLDLLDGSVGAGAAKGPALEIRADLETLVGLADRAGEIPGFGPVVSDIARQVATERKPSRVTYRVTAPDGTIHSGVTRRRPTAGLQRDVESRYEWCVFPGCRMPATECDLDHLIPWSEGGPTDEEHLAPLCRHDHHVVRHQAGWSYERLENGDHEWMSPLGHTYVSRGRSP